MNLFRNKSNIRIVLYSLLSSVQMSFVGTLILSEVYAGLFSLNFRRIKQLQLNNPDVKRIQKALFIFLLIQMLSDVLNHNSMNNMLRGWAAIAVSLVVFTFMFRMFDDTPRIILAFMCAEIVRLILFGDSNFEQDTSSVMEDYSLFKFKIAPITNYITYLITFYTYNKRKDKLTVAILILYGLISVGLDYRSNGLFFIFGGLIIHFRKVLMNMTLARKIGITIFVAILFQILYMFYVNAVLSGEFGGKHAGDQLSETGNPYNPFSLIGQGRGEFFVAIEAIKDAPWLGHGSWAVDEGNHYRSLMFKDLDKDRSRMLAMSSSGVIPSHSVLLGAWLYGGVIAFLCIFYIFWLTMKRAFSLIVNERAMETPYYPIIVLFTIQLLWIFPFSPLPHIRSLLPLMIGFILTIYHSIQNEEDDEEEDLLPDNG
ncbi:hypothetical protein [Chitinophaga sp.]|uniref:hypothetical protein n=1 Tax=Chitinophaga sp. TaxID=1869181 RepID=UPI0031CF62F5